MCLCCLVARSLFGLIVYDTVIVIVLFAFVFVSFAFVLVVARYFLRGLFLLRSGLISFVILVGCCV